MRPGCEGRSIRGRMGFCDRVEELKQELRD